jgi:hypothetical protein
MRWERTSRFLPCMAGPRRGRGRTARYTAQPWQERHPACQHERGGDGAVARRGRGYHCCGLRDIPRAGTGTRAAQGSGGRDGQSQRPGRRARSQVAHRAERLRACVSAVLLSGPQSHRGSFQQGKGARCARPKPVAERHCRRRWARRTRPSVPRIRWASSSTAATVQRFKRFDLRCSMRSSPIEGFANFACTEPGKLVSEGNKLLRRLHEALRSLLPTSL